MNTHNLQMNSIASNIFSIFHLSFERSNDKVYFISLLAPIKCKFTPKTRILLKLKLYHSLGRDNRQQIDDMFVILSLKKKGFDITCKDYFLKKKKKIFKNVIC